MEEKGTNGMVVIRVRGQIYMKIATSVDGQSTAQVAERLRDIGRVPSLGVAVALVVRSGFKDETHLVVVTRNESFYGGSQTGAAVVACRKTFDDLDFNPIWEDGRNDFRAVMDF